MLIRKKTNLQRFTINMIKENLKMPTNLVKVTIKREYSRQRYPLVVRDRVLTENRIRNAVL